jgi:type IV pilus assembly protein PilC
VKRKTISALVYPAILLVLSCIVVAIIVLKVVPEFGLFYKQFDRPLPLSTRIIVSISDFALTSFFVIALAVIGAVMAFIAWMKKAGNRRRFDKWTLSIPMIGPIAQKFATSQAARTLATLLGGGIPLVNAIDVSARSIGNRYMAQELTIAAQQVREGRALAAALMQSGAFPDVSIKMVEVGESTGALQEMLNSLSEFYDEEIDTSLTRFITIVEPVLLVVMGIIIAALLLSLYMPLFNLSSMIT